MKRVIPFLLILTLFMSTISTQTVFAADASDIVVSQEKDVDVVLSVGSSTTDISKFNADLTDALVKLGVPEKRINIQSIEAKDVDANNNFAWEIYDHTNNIANAIASYKPYYNETNGNYILDNHITVSAINNVTNIDFFGYGAPAYKDFMYMPDANSGKKIIDFTIEEGSFYDALNGPGFLFNTSMSANTDLPNRTMSGYLLLFNYYPSYSGNPPVIEVHKFENVNVDAFHNTTSTNIQDYSGFTKIASYQAGSQKKRVVRLEATPTELKFYYKEGALTDAITLSDSDLKTWNLTSNGTASAISLPKDFSQYGFGPMVGYSSHGCSLRTHFTFKNIIMSTESTKKFSEIIREPEWRESASHFIINLEDQTVPDFEDSEKLGEILSRMGNDEIHYLGWGTSANQAQANAFINKNNNKGTFALNTDYSKSINDMAAYIYSVYLASKDSSGIYLDVEKPQELSVTPAEEKYNTIDGTWPQGKWKVLHFNTFYDSDEGQAVFHNQYMDDLDVTFTKPGKYEVYYKDTLVKTVYAHRKPVASFAVVLDSSGNVTLTDQSYDLDHFTTTGKGIDTVQYQWKETSGTTWTTGAPSSLEASKNYIISQVVKDLEGEWSKPYYRYVSTNSASLTLKSVPEFSIDKYTVFKSPGTISITDTSYSPTGTITQKEWSILKDGVEVYAANASPKLDFSDQDAGIYKIRLRTQNVNGWSDYFIRTLTVVVDATAPTATASPLPGIFNDITNVTLTFTDAGGSLLKSQQVAITGDTNVPTNGWSTNGNTQTRIVQFDELGTYYIHYKAEDNSGNMKTGYIGPYLLLSEDQETVTRDKDVLEILYQDPDTANSVTKNVTLPTTVTNGSVVTWASSMPGTIDAAGNVYRPSAAQGNTGVVLTATLRKGIAVETKVFHLTASALIVADDQEAVTVDKANLAIGYQNPDNASSVTKNVTLPGSASNGSTVTWSSSVPGTLANNGTVTRPESNLSDVKVTITATITKAAGTETAVTETKVFEVIVKKEGLTDAAAVAADKALVEIGYAEGDSSAYVTRNLTLPTTASNGSSVSWSSNNTATISDGSTGIVTRPAIEGSDAAVTLTATISKGSSSETKTFNLTVKKVLAGDSASIAADKEALVVIYATGDTDTSVTQNVTLVTSMGNGSSVAWSSDKIGVIATSGSVTRRADVDETVVLTATISRGTETSDTKTFTLIVKKQPETTTVADLTDIAAAKSALAITYGAGDDSAHVRLNVGLPSTGGNGTTVTWSSNKQGTIDSLGNVFRPGYLTGDQTVRLTATITKNQARDTQVFDLTVLALGSNDLLMTLSDKSSIAIGYQAGDSATSVTKNVTLPLVGSKGSTVVWTSNVADTVSKSGIVTRPSIGSPDVIVKLIATITLNELTETKVFYLLVKANEATPPPTTSRNNDEPKRTGTIVIVNGQAENAGTETVEEIGGKTIVEVEVNAETIINKIQEVLKNGTGENNVVEIPVVANDSDKITVTLTGDIVKKMQDEAFDLSIQSDDIEYIIPAEEIGILNVAQGLGVSADSLKKIEVEIKINQVDDAIVKKIMESASAKEYEIVFPPVDFEIIAKAVSINGTVQKITVAKFNHYVERIMEISAGVDPKKITTGVVYNVDGTFSHIPTDIFVKEGKYFARLSSLTNSSYSVIWNPITVSTVENHWSKLAVNDMASRLIIKKPETFMPNEAISRAEFAEYITKALGIYRTNVTKDIKFNDVNLSSEVADAIQIAVNYGIIAGYPDGTFKPNQTISREEAMTMYARAMDIVGLKEVNNNRIETYSDAKLVSKWAYAYVQKTVSANVFNGRTKETIVPKGIITYAEAATAIRNLLVEADLINK